MSDEEGLSREGRAPPSFVSGEAKTSRRKRVHMTQEQPAANPSSPAAPAPEFANALQGQPTVELNIKTLLDAGAHFGHQTERWNPKMLPYIFGERNGIHIINLDLTLQAWKRARDFIVNKVGSGGTILFVGTKLQAREIIKTEAERCGAFYVNTRWLGGTLTNFQTIKNSIERMKKLEDLLQQAGAEGSEVRLNKKERLTISRQLERLEKSIGGIRGMRRAPDIMFVLDVAKEDIAIAEAKRLKIPVVAIVDTNVDPDPVNYPIPSNDDAARTIKLLMGALADAVLEGKKLAESRNIRPDEDRGGEGETRPYRRGRGGDRDHYRGGYSRSEGSRHEGARSAEAPKPVEAAKPAELPETPRAPSAV